MDLHGLTDYHFLNILYEKMKLINPGIADLELYEFGYGLDSLNPVGDWDSVRLDRMEEIEERLDERSFYEAVQIKPRVDGKIVLDENIVRLAKMLFVGLVTGEYGADWVRLHFYFDVRGFYFLPRTVYFSNEVLAHFGGKPYRSFEPRQMQLEGHQSIGYPEFQAANAEVDQLFMESVIKLVAVKGTPIILGIAGPTAAGKTEIVARLYAAFKKKGQKTTSIEMDNFLTDRDDREEKGIDSLGQKAIHFDLFMHSLEEISQGKKIAIPRYDFISGGSSHNLDGSLKPGGLPVEIEPADIIFIEGNFPFLIKEANPWIGIKIVYLTDDPIRLKRKWKRDMDYRKKYDLNYFRNRFFKDQFLMAQQCFLPQMLECDILVDTTGARLWATVEFAENLSRADRERGSGT